MIKLIKSKGFKIVLSSTVAVLLFLSIPEIIHKNKGKSESIGSVRNGSLKNGYLMPYSGTNFSYFSPFSYYILNNAYTHQKVYNTIIQAYKTCENTCPGIKFGLMETSDKHGGKLMIHRTHQNGLSADFMIPKKRKEKQSRVLDRLGLSHYLLFFDDDGKNNIAKSISLDFESMGKHIIALDDAAKTNGLAIRKIILKIALKDDLLATEAGKEISRRGIYIVQNLSDIVDTVHDEHYHIDFRFL